MLILQGISPAIRNTGKTGVNMNRIAQHNFLDVAKTLGRALCQNPMYAILDDETRLNILVNCCKVYINEIKAAKEKNYAVIAEQFINYLVSNNWAEMVAKNQGEQL